MCLWFRDEQGRLWGTQLLETGSGHLQIPVQGQLTDLSGLRKRAEDKYHVSLPFDAPSLLDLLATPGALAELQKSQDKVQKYTVRVPESMHVGSCEPRHFSMIGVSSWQRDARFSEHVADPPAELCLSEVAEESIFAIRHEQLENSVLRPPLPQRLGNLALRLAQLRLRSTTWQPPA